MRLALEKARNIFFAVPNTKHTHTHTHTHTDTHTLFQMKAYLAFSVRRTHRSLTLILRINLSLVISFLTSGGANFPGNWPQGLFKKMAGMILSGKVRLSLMIFLQDKVCNLHLKQYKK